MKSRATMIGGLVVEACLSDKCGKINNGICTRYSYPEAQWKPGRRCPLSNAAGNDAIGISKDGRKVNPLKASKRSGKK